MNPRSPIALALAAAVLFTGHTAGLAPQDADATPKKIGKIFKREVDGLINGLSSAAPKDGSLGGTTCLQTAKVLTAMGHSHRFYSMGDGPLSRRGVHRLFTGRQRDGSFADPGASDAIVETTEWVIDALAIMDPENTTEEIAAGRRWLAAQGAPEHTAWERLLESIRERARNGETPDIAGQAASQRASFGLIRDESGQPDLDATTGTLLELVACQFVAREVDRGQIAKTPEVEPEPVLPEPFSETQQRGIDYLLTQQKDGEFFVVTPGGKFPDPGLSGLGLAALLTKPESLRTDAERQVIEQGLATLKQGQNPDGSFGRQTVNYTTCAVVLALTKAGGEGYTEQLAKAQKYLLGIQNIEDQGYERGDRDYGSIGYGGDQRGDLSNLQMAVEALRNTGLSENHESFAKAIVFLQRTQNLRSVNDFTKRVRDSDTGDYYQSAPGDDGGAAYYPGNSAAGYVELPDGTRLPRSYGSMTYALLKTYTLAGVKPDDERVQAAVRWIAANWTLEENPGASPQLPEKARYQGLYYYYMVMSQALATMSIDQLEVTVLGATADTAPTVKSIDWREQLRNHLTGLQAENGSWLNHRNDRWFEGQSALCTIYALLALSHVES